MAAYAALVSLMNIIDNIQNHPRVSTFLDKKQIESLSENVGLLLDFVESDINSDVGISKEEVEDLESQIASAAHTAEDVIESHIVDQIQAGSTETSPCFLIDLQKIIEDMDSIVEKVKKVKEERGLKDQQPTYSKPAASSRSPPTSGKTTMVGFDGYLNQLLDWLTGQTSDRQIISIIGMGGIVSQEYNVREILLETLSCLGGFASNDDERTEAQLGEQLYKSLSGMRYLIILDDMWSIDAWNKIKFFFPKNHNRSRIVITTRQSDVANHLSSLELDVNFLDDDSSWDLFCEKAFAQEGCPSELEEIGKKIVKKCKGLPLAIVVIGGLLEKSSRAQEYWENVEKDLSSILRSKEDNHCLNILSLSYSHLPAYLKPCFLYLGIFLEDQAISVSRLIKLWVAEGFLKPNKPNKEQSLEEIAKGYIKDLVDRNLVLVRRLSPNGKFKTCSIHDLVRDLCIKVAEKEKLFCVMRELNTPRDIDRERRIIIHESIGKEECDIGASHALKSASLARSVIGQGRRQFLLKPKLLRVMPDAFTSLGTTFQQVNLRFIEKDSYGQGYSSGIYKLPS